MKELFASNVLHQINAARVKKHSIPSVLFAKGRVLAIRKCPLPQLAGHKSKTSCV